MPLVRVFVGDPGEERLVEATSINLVEELAIAVRAAGGRGSIGYVAATVDDRGVPAVPYLMSSPREFRTIFGGFRSWLGDALPAASEGTLAANHWEDRGAASGYIGNGLAQVEGLDAPVVVLQVPDLALKDDSIGASPAGEDVLVTLTRATATFGAFSLPAGTRISDATPGGPYVVATLERVFWAEDETGDKTVRVRQVSPQAILPVSIANVDTFVDAPEDTAVTVATVAITTPDLIDSAELTLRYEHALLHLLDTAAGRQVELVVTDRTEAAIGDAVSSHCLSASGQGLFRLGAVAPDLGTTAVDARTDATVGVARTTLQRRQVSYCHPGWQRQFRLDADHLSAANQYVTTMPSHVAWAYLAAQRRPEENPARPHPILVSYKAVGTESLALGQPDLKAHEQAGITQPLLDTAFGTQSQVATYHASPMASADIKFATRRMALFLYRNYIAIAANYHKSFASPSNRQAFLSAIDAFVDRLLLAGRVAATTPAQGDWDPAPSQYTVSKAVDETGNLDIITLRPTFGPSAIADAGL